MRVAFVHPDLGLGGAERLVVDAAAELASRGHKVDLYTAYFDPRRCFKETLEGTFRVIVAGGWFPRQLLGRCTAFCAYVRCLLAALTLSRSRYDVVFVDQVSVVIPLLRRLSSAKVLFYCHFPDFLLAQPKGRLHRLYRSVLDNLEETTTGQAHCVLVNSRYTQGIFYHAFPSLQRRALHTQVLYPAVQLQPLPGPWQAEAASSLPASLQQFLASDHIVFLSINRFERKKDIALAVRALEVALRLPASSTPQVSLLRRLTSSPSRKAPVRPLGLVLAGGYDQRLLENREVLAELQSLARDLGVQDHVVFLPSFTDEQRGELLQACRAVVYTPANEHFGIVPLEAMAAGRPVIAANSGGPLETVKHQSTGLLCEPQPEAFARAMMALTDASAASAMGEQARQHVEDSFSRQAFGSKLETIMLQLVHGT